MRQPLRKNTTYFVVFLENRTLYSYINLSTDFFTYTLLVLHKILSTNLDIRLKKLSYTVYFKFYLKCIVQLHASTNLTGKKWIKMNTDKKKPNNKNPHIQLFPSPQKNKQEQILLTFASCISIVSTHEGIYNPLSKLFF